MKTFLVLVLSVVALFVWQHSANQKPVAEPHRETKAAATAAPRAVSERNWAKNSLDRAHEVMNEVRRTREQNQEP